MRFWRWRQWLYVDGAAQEWNERAAETVNWVRERCIAELEKPQLVVAFIYGIATATQAKDGMRVTLNSSTGGIDAVTLDLITSLVRNLAELLAKNPKLFAGAPWRTRLCWWLLMKLP